MCPEADTKHCGSPQAPEPADGVRPSAPAPRAPEPRPPRFTAGAYFIGKALWGKGYTELLALLAAHKAATGVALRVDAYGAGEDAEDICAKARTAMALSLLLHGTQEFEYHAVGMKLCCYCSLRRRSHPRALSRASAAWFSDLGVAAGPAGALVQ